MIKNLQKMFHIICECPLPTSYFSVASLDFIWFLSIANFYAYAHECKVHICTYILSLTQVLKYQLQSILCSTPHTYLLTSVAGSSICLCRRQQFYMWDHASLLNCTLWGLFVVLLVLQKQAAAAAVEQVESTGGRGTCCLPELPGVPLLDWICGSPWSSQSCFSGQRVMRWHCIIVWVKKMRLISLDYPSPKCLIYKIFF